MDDDELEPVPMSKAAALRDMRREEDEVDVMIERNPWLAILDDPYDAALLLLMDLNLLDVVGWEDLL